MFVQSTLEANIHPIDTIKKAWPPGMRLVQDADGFMTGFESLAAVLQYADMADFCEELGLMFIHAGISANIIFRDKKGGYTVDYPVR